MSYWYSPGQNGFYCEGIHPEIPADAVELAADAYRALLDGQCAGQRIVADSDGQPVLADPPAPTLDELRAARDAALSAECAAAIVAGVECDALGAPHHYPTGPTDQSNLTGAVTYSLLFGTPADWQQPLTCRAAAGTWARRPHDRAQLYAVAAVVVTHVDTCRARLAALRAQLAIATDPAALTAITWSTGHA